MKKKLALSISIPTPCHENWDKMTPNEKGRHCASCNKTVIDFSDYSDRQLIEFFSKLNGSVCGRLTSVQVGRTIEYAQPPRFPFLYKLLFGTALASWLGIATASGQSTNTLPKMEQKATTNKAEQNSKKDTALTKPGYLDGVLVDAKTGEPIPFANVIMESNGHRIDSAYTDIDGKFSLSAPIDPTHKVVLECAYVGYKEIEREIKPTDMNLTLKMEAVSMGFTVGIIIHTPINEITNTPDKTTHTRRDNPYLSPR